MLTNLLNIAKTLRGEKGCAWDKKQTLSKYPKRLFEESKEIQEAIEKADYENLKEEIGDVLFNLVMMMEISEEEGHFSAKEVIKTCEEKLINRHSWVFGDDKVETPEEAEKLWEANKKKENKS